MKPAKTVAEMTQEPPQPLTLGAGDVIDVKHFYVPELDESQIVRPDGYMTLPLIGEVEVDGKTPAQLQKDLVNKYKPHLSEPHLTVMVRRVYNSRIWVTGEVKRPGAVEKPGRLTVLEAITQVGGGTRPTADLRQVLVVRQKDDVHYGCLVNVKDILAGKAGAQFVLQPRDVVYVPPTSITRANDWMDQYINKMAPQARTVVLYPLGPDNAGVAGIDTSSR
jgi:protein involved in polysaccharide export with SLBB domain